VKEYTQKDATRLQAGFFGWLPDFATPGGFILPALGCPVPFESQGDPVNPARFCSPAIDRQMARAQSLETSNPQSALALWAKVDRDITDQAPWVSFANGLIVQLVSTRVGNYQYNPQYGTLLDQLWVR
jgi:peptide/nickel transport system substrate-binding protein